MNQIRLHFTDSVNPELTEVEFLRQNEIDAFRAVRGKISGQIETSRTFQWTPAVKALTVLLLSARSTEILSAEIGIGELSGGKGSLASTLDYAISKQPAWITDIFGTYNGGNCYLRKLVTRTNAERKHPGPVIIKLNTTYLAPSNITAFQNQRELNAQECFNLIKTIQEESCLKFKAKIVPVPGPVISLNFAEQSPERQNLEIQKSDNRVCSVSEYLEYQQSLGPLPAPFADLNWELGLRSIYKKELSEVLTSSDIFSKSGRDLALKNLSENSPLSKILGKHKILLDEIEMGIAGLSRLGISEEFPWFREYLLKRKPLTISFASVHVGAIAIAKALRNLKKFNITVNNDYPHSTDLVQKVLSLSRSDAPDLFCVNLATAAWFIGENKHTGYVPFMLMPMFSQRIQSPKMNKGRINKNIGSGEFHFMSEIPTSAYLYFEEMAQSGIIQKRKTSVCETDLLDIPSLLVAGDSESKIISPFPLYRFYETYDVEYLDTTVQSKDFGYRSTVLFVKEELKSEARLLKVLNLAIRDTWLELVEDETFLEQALDLLVSDRNYIKTISRMAGLHFISSAKERSPEVLKSWNSTEPKSLTKVANFKK